MVEPIVGLPLDLFAVEVSVTVAGGACEGFNRAFFSTRHELAATIGGIATHGGCVVLETLFVFDVLLIVVAVVVIVVGMMVMEISFHLGGWEWAAAVDRSNDVVAGGGRVMMVVVDDVVVVVAAVATI